MEIYNLLDTINKGANENIYAMPQNIGGNFNFGENDWQPLPFTSFSCQDQILADSILYNNLDVISNSQSFDRLKIYEHKFNISSEEFYERWIKGEAQTNEEVHDWMAVYKSLFVNV